MSDSSDRVPRSHVTVSFIRVVAIYASIWWTTLLGLPTTTRATKRWFAVCYYQGKSCTFIASTIAKSGRCSSFKYPKTSRLQQEDSSQKTNSNDDADASPQVVSSNFWYTVIQKNDSLKTRSPNSRIVVVPPQQRKQPGLPRAGEQGRRLPVLPPLPCVPTLDAHGPLPPDAYIQTSPSSPYAKPTSRIQMAWDVSLPQSSLQQGLDNGALSRNDVDAMVSVLHGAIDDGITTFQLKSLSHNQQCGFSSRWAMKHVYGSLIRDTPSTVLQHCQLVVPFSLDELVSNMGGRISESSTNGLLVTPKTIRPALVQRLTDMKCDSIDNLQIHFSALAQNPSGTDVDDYRYYLDLLDALRDFQDQGLLRSVSTHCMPRVIWRQAHMVGLSDLIDSHQHDANLLNPQHLFQSSDDDGTGAKQPWTVVSNALAGGWLTDRYYLEQPTTSTTHRNNRDKRRTMESDQWLPSLSETQQASWRCNVQASAWASSRHSNGVSLSWQDYQSTILQPLADMARKHRTSMASIVLRWTLECGKANVNVGNSPGSSNNVAGVVVASRLLPENCYDWADRQRFGKEQSKSSRASQLRSVFQFQLDDEDRERLHEIATSCLSVPTDQQHDSTMTNDDFEDEYQPGNNKRGRIETRNGLWVPNRKGK